MICITNKIVTMAEIEDANTKSRLVLIVDDTEEAPKVTLTIQRYSRKQKAYLPTEEILALTDPEELDDLARLAVEILNDTGYLSIRGEEEPDD